MAVPGNLSNSDLVSIALKEISPLFIEHLAPLVNILKAVGVAFFVYLLFLIYRSYVRIQDHKRLKRIEEKLDLVLKNKKFSK